MQLSRIILSILSLAALVNSVPVEKRADPTEYLIVLEFIAIVGIVGFANFMGAVNSCNGDGGCKANAVSAYCTGSGECENAAWNVIASSGLKL